MPETDLIGVIAGVKSELAAFDGSRDAANAPMLRLSGARPAQAETQVRDLINTGCKAILSFGVCGALDPKLRPGDLIVADAVITPSGQWIACDPQWAAGMAGKLMVSTSTILGSDRVADVAFKSQAYAETKAAVVDMESHIAAKLATEADLPFAVLRAVTDPADLDIPAWVLKSVRTDGSINMSTVLSGVLTHPLQVGTLMALGRANKRAMASLRGAVVRLGPTLGFLAR
jgi:adenosylhomocysteine nucleosidase